MCLSVSGSLGDEAFSFNATIFKIFFQLIPNLLISVQVIHFRKEQPQKLPLSQIDMFQKNVPS